MKKEGMIAYGRLQIGDQFMIDPKDVTLTRDLPIRTDDQQPAAPFLRVKERVKEPDGPKWSRTHMYEYLLDQYGPQC